MKTSDARETQKPVGENQVKPNISQVDNKSVFLGAVLSMSWQLAVVVLLPIIGGYYVDQHFDSQPAWTIVGFVLALGGVITVFRQMLRIVDSSDKNNHKDNKGNSNK